MESLNKIIYNIKNLYNQGRISDDFNLTNRQISYIIDQVRAAIVYPIADVLSNEDISNLTQTIVPIEMMRVDKSETDTILTNDIILRSVNEIPSAIKIIRISQLDNTPVQSTNVAKAQWSIHLPFMKDKMEVYLRNNYLWLRGNCLIKYLKLDAIFESPSEVAEMNSGADCFDDTNFMYPISKHLLEKMMILIDKGAMEIYRRSEEDEDNDTSADVD